MLTTRSLRHTVATALFLSIPHFARAQFPYTIGNISILLAGQTNLDLFQLYDPRSGEFEVDIGFGMCWNILESNGQTLPFTFSTANASVEVISGTSQAQGNNVMDIAGVNIGPDVTCITYWPPTNLPLGGYHFRINSTVNTTTTNTTIQNLSARGADFNLTDSTPLGCGPGLKPGPYTPVTSPTASGFTSAFFVSPWGGELFFNDTTSIGVSWQYKNGLNAENNEGISNVTVQVLDSSGNNVGSSQSVPQSSLFGVQPGVTVKTDGLKVNSSYTVKLTYTNQFPDGATPAGGLNTLISGEFNIVEEQTNCTLLALAGNSSSSGSSGSQGGSSGSGGSSSRNAAVATGITYHIVAGVVLLVAGMMI